MTRPPCPCCGKTDCVCENCSCVCCKDRSGATSAQQQEAGGQHPPCGCPCCEKRSCDCEQQSDCSCSGCERHVCPCPAKAEMKATKACDCCCCKTDNPSCTESRHQRQSCECRCCRGDTCAHCKSKQAGASVPGAQPAAGKILFNAVHDSNVLPGSTNSSGSRFCCPAASSSCNSCRHCISRSTLRHCMSGTRNHTHCSTCRTQCCCSSITERQCHNPDGCRCTHETVNSICVSCIPRVSTDCPSCGFLSNFPCFFAPHFVYRGRSCKQHASCCRPPVRAYDGVRCCNGDTSSTCWCCTSMKRAAVGTSARPPGAAAVVDGGEPSEKSQSAAFLQGESRSSSSRATAHDSDVARRSEHLDTPESEVSYLRSNCKRQCLLTRDVAAEEHELQRQQRLEEYAVEQQPGQRANQEQQWQGHDEGRKNNSCILDPEGRLLIECKTKEKVLLRRMQPTDYAAVRALLPRVSRCTLVLTDKQVHDVLASSVFYAWCCFTVEPKEPLPQQQQQPQEGTLSHAEEEQRDVEGQVQKLANQQQTKEQQQLLQQGQQLQQEAMEDRPEFYRETKLVAYCELVLQPRLGRKTDGRLERVVVNEAFCGRGLAWQMCSAVLAAVKERGLCGSVDLTVENAVARHIYEDKLGFRKVETTVMRLHL